MLVEAVDPGADQRLHVGGYLESFYGARQPVGAGRAFELSGFDQGVDHLFGVERVAAGPVEDALREGAHRGVVAEQALDHLADRVHAERHEGKLLVVGLVAPARLVLGAEVQHE